MSQRYLDPEDLACLSAMLEHGLEDEQITLR